MLMSSNVSGLKTQTQADKVILQLRLLIKYDVRT